jgi:DNA polymerase III alpha subunit (gram-positive type)
MLLFLLTLKIGDFDNFIFVAHNMNFDFRVLMTEMNNLGLTFPSSWIFIDSIPIFQNWNLKQDNQLIILLKNTEL